jgi:hypothetical protein
MGTITSKDGTRDLPQGLGLGAADRLQPRLAALGRGGSRVAEAVLISAVPPLMVQAESNPGGLPKSVFDDFQAQLAANRSDFYRPVDQARSTATSGPARSPRRRSPRAGGARR